MPDSRRSRSARRGDFPEDDPGAAPGKPLADGRLLARGVCRHLQSRNFACLEEFVPRRGLRLDVMALGSGGEFWIVECKSSRADFQADSKWQAYLEWGDRYFWAVGPDFPVELLPPQSGLIIADGFDAEILRMAPKTPLAAARRKALTRRFARNAALRLRRLLDPGAAAHDAVQAAMPGAAQAALF